MLRVGFNGVSIANTTNPEINKKGEDVNIGWHALAKAYGNGKQSSLSLSLWERLALKILMLWPTI